MENFFFSAVPQPATLLKKRLWHRCFPVNFTKFIRTPFLTEHFQWLLLMVLFLFFIFTLIFSVWRLWVRGGWAQKGHQFDILHAKINLRVSPLMFFLLVLRNCKRFFVQIVFGDNIVRFQKFVRIKTNTIRRLFRVSSS